MIKWKSVKYTELCIDKMWNNEVKKQARLFQDLKQRQGWKIGSTFA